ncbi:alpha/beta hydrolase [Nocardioides aurantiacus]|uniref:Acetyl esterase n=1 Tax=Nocardioides aurantiacus TaxID=86796 RepID=A0A3N2CR70_9ACTN|nr:alpha/beta hydrolase [Nocardioides aurantiacus]ROR89906.1 acetyl esterase [Nocardioides aurantiacus]
MSLLSSRADRRAWWQQRLAPLLVRYDRELVAALRRPGDRPVRPTKVRLQTRHGRVDALLYAPEEQRCDLPVHVHLHGGAFVMRRPRMDEFVAQHLVDRLGIAVLLPDYAVAPQVRYPVAHEQVHDVLLRLSEQGPHWGLDPTRVSVGGFSSGGNLAAAAALLARDSGGPRLRALTLGVPSLDVASTWAQKAVSLPAGAQPMLGASVLELVRATYFRDPDARRQPYGSPLLAPSLSRLPPTLVVTAGLDLLREEGERFAARLDESGVAVRLHRVEGRDHYFLDPTNVAAELDLLASHLRTTLA